MSTRLKYVQVSEITPTHSPVLLQIRTGTAAGSRLVATVHTTLDATLRSIRERLVEIAVKGAVTSSSRAVEALGAESASFIGLSEAEVKAIVSHRLHAFDMSADFEFVQNGGATSYTHDEEQRTHVHEALPLVPSFGLPSTSPSWRIEPRAGSVAVRRNYRENTSLTINIEKNSTTGQVTKNSNALLILYVKQTSTELPPPLPGADGMITDTPQGGIQPFQCERVMAERLLMSDVPFGKMITPRHLSLLVTQWNVNVRDLLGRTILHECCADGNLAVVRYLLSLATQMTIVADAVDNNGRTCLHYAVIGGHASVVAELLNANNSPHFRPSPRVFHFSANATKAIAVAEEELASVARALPFNPLHPDYSGRTPLHIALSLRHDALTEVLCGAIAALPLVVLRSLHTCVFNLYYGVSAPPGRGFVGARLAEVMGGGGPASKKRRLPWEGEERFSSVTQLFAQLSPSLTQLAEEGDIEAMVVLLSHPLLDKASACQRGAAGESLLHLAARKGKTDMVRFLTSDDFAELFPQNDFLPSISRVLDSNWLAVSMLDDCGRTPLHYACRSGFADTVLELLRHATASAPLANGDGEGSFDPPQGRCNSEDSSSDDDENHGRALLAPNTTEETSLIVHRNAKSASAHANRKARLVNLNVNAVDACGCTALQWALRNGHIDCARVLLEVFREAVGTSSELIVTLSDLHGVSPLHAAAASGADDVVHTLIEDYRVPPNIRVQTRTSYNTRSAPSDTTLQGRREASRTSGYQLLDAAPAPDSKSTHRIRVFVRTLGPSPLWLALREGKQTTAALLIDLGALSGDGLAGSPIIDLDLAGKRVEKAKDFVLFERRSIKAQRRRGARHRIVLPSTNAHSYRNYSHEKNLHDAQYWHLCSMLKLSLEMNWLNLSQLILNALNSKGLSDRLSRDAHLLVSFTARQNDYALRWLIDRGVGKASHSMKNGLTVLSACCYARNVEAVRYLLESIPGVEGSISPLRLNEEAEKGEGEPTFHNELIVVSPLYLAVASTRHEAASTELVDILLKKMNSYKTRRGTTSAVLTQSNSLNTPRASLYLPIVQASLRGEYSIVQTLCNHASTTAKESAVALWWLLNCVPSTRDVLMVRRTVAKVLEAAEGPLNAKLRAAFGEPSSVSSLDPRAFNYVPTTSAVARYDAIAVSLFRKVRFVAESPFHPIEILRLAASKLWHFGSLVRTIVSTLGELPMDVKRAVLEASTPMNTTYSHIRPTSEEANTAPRVRILPASGKTFIDSMSDGSFPPYHRLVNRDAFMSILCNAPSTPEGMQGWYAVTRQLVEECGVFPSRYYDRSQRTGGDYAFLSGHAPTAMYAMALGLMPTRRDTTNFSSSTITRIPLLAAPLKAGGGLHARDRRFETLSATAMEAVSFLLKHRSIDYATGSIVPKGVAYVDVRKSRLIRDGGKLNTAYFRPPRKDIDARRAILPITDLQEAASMACILSLINRGNVSGVRSALGALSALCRITDFSPVHRANYGVSGPVYGSAASMAVRITNQWGAPLVLAALSTFNEEMLRVLVEEFGFNVAAPVVGKRVGSGAQEPQYQLLPNAIAMGCSNVMIELLIKHKVPLAVPSHLTKTSQTAIKKRLPGLEFGPESLFTCLFVAAAVGRLEVIRMIQQAVCGEGLMGWGGAPEACFANAFFRPHTGSDFGDGSARRSRSVASGASHQSDRDDEHEADGALPGKGDTDTGSSSVYFDALSAAVSSRPAAGQGWPVAERVACEIAHFLICKGGWPLVNPYVLRIAARRGHWALCRLLLSSYGPSVVISDLNVRAAEVAEEDRVLQEKKGILMGPTGAASGTGDTLDFTEIAALLSRERVQFASPEKLKGLNKCSALSVALKRCGQEVGDAMPSNLHDAMPPSGCMQTSRLRGVAMGGVDSTYVFAMAIDLLALSDRFLGSNSMSTTAKEGVVAVVPKISGAEEGARDEDADREMDTVDERIERLKHELHESIMGGYGRGGSSYASRSSQAKWERSSASVAGLLLGGDASIGLYRHNVALPPAFASVGTASWESLLMNHRPSLLKASISKATRRGGRDRITAAYLALLAFCTQPPAHTAEVIRTVALDVSSQTKASAQRSGNSFDDTTAGATVVFQQLLSLLTTLTKTTSKVALLPIDGYERLHVALKTAVQRNQSRLLKLLLDVSIAVVTKARLSDLEAMRGTSRESLYYLALQHLDGECAAVMTKALEERPHDAYLRVLCNGAGVWTSTTAAVPFAAAALQATKLTCTSLGRVSRPMRTQFVSTAIDTLAFARGHPLSIALLDSSPIHSCYTSSSSAPSLMSALRPAFSSLPGGVVCVAASPLLIAVMLGLEEVVHTLVASGALAAHCSSSRAYATRFDLKVALVSHESIFSSPDEASRLAFFRDTALSSTIALPAVYAAVALCLKAALRVQSSSFDSSTADSRGGGSASKTALSTETAFADFKRRALIVMSLFKHGALTADNISVISVAVGHILQKLSRLRLTSTLRVAVGTARAELLDVFLRSASAACGSLGGPFLMPLRLTDKKRHPCLFTLCDLPNYRHMLHAMLGGAGVSLAGALSAVDVDMLKAVLRCTSPADVENARDGKGRSVLYYLLANAVATDGGSSSGSSPNIFVFLTESMIAVHPDALNTPCHHEEGWTPLMVAARYGRTDAVLTLLGFVSHAGLSQKDKKGRNALWHACAYGHTMTARGIIDFIKVSGTPLSDFFYTECEGLNPLLAAAWNGHDDTAMKLLELLPAKLVFKLSKSMAWPSLSSDGNPSSSSASVTTILHAAAKGGCVRLVGYLADLYVKAPLEFSKLCAGIGIQTLNSGSNVILSPFRQAGPFIAADSAGLTPISIAYYAGHVNVLGKLLSLLRDAIKLGISGGAEASSLSQFNSANASVAAIVAALRSVGDDVLSTIDKGLLIGADLDPYSGTAVRESSNTFSAALADSDPLERAQAKATRKREDATPSTSTARERCRSVLPIGWFGATLKLNALLLKKNGGKNGKDNEDGGAAAFTSVSQRQFISEAGQSLLRWCVANGMMASIRVCCDLGLTDGYVKETGLALAEVDDMNESLPPSRPAIGVRTALHIAASALNVDVAQLLVSLNMSSPFALDKYGNTPLDVCLQSGRKSVPSPTLSIDNSSSTRTVGDHVDVTCGDATIMSAAERCARFLLEYMFSKPSAMAQFRLPDGTLYIHTLFHKIAATRMPDLINFVHTKLLAMAGSGSSSPNASALFVLQMLQRQDSESLRHATIMKKILAAQSGGATEADGDHPEFGNEPRGEDEDEGNSTSTTKVKSIFHTDMYTPFEISLFHGCHAMVLRIAETIRSLAMVAAAVTVGKNYYGAHRPGSVRSGGGVKGIDHLSNPMGEEDGDGGLQMHPLGHIALSASYLRDHLSSVSPTIRAILFDLFRVTWVTTGCGMARLSSSDMTEHGHTLDDDEQSANENDNTDHEERRTRTLKASPPQLFYDYDNRLSFADVRAIGVSEMSRDSNLATHVDAIYTLSHEREMLVNELMPRLLKERSAAAASSRKKASTSSTSSPLPLRIELDESCVNELPEPLQRMALRAFTTSAVAGRYVGIDTAHRFPFLSSIVVRFVQRADAATGLSVSAEGPARLLDTIALVDGFIVTDTSTAEKEQRDAVDPLGIWSTSAFTSSRSFITTSTNGLDINEAIASAIGAQLPALKKQLDAQCLELSNFFLKKAKLLPAWRSFTPFHNLSVRVEWSSYINTSTYGVTNSATAVVPLEVQSAITKLLGTFSQRSSAMSQYKELAIEMERAMSLLLGDGVLGGRLSARQYLADEAQRGKGASGQSNVSCSSASILSELFYTLLESGFGREGEVDVSAPPQHQQPVARGICFSFFPTSNAIAASSGNIGSNGSRGRITEGTLVPLRSTDVSKRHREGAELVIPFCALGLGRPFVRGDGLATLEPILSDPLRTFLYPLFDSVERAGAFQIAQQLKTNHLLEPLKRMLSEALSNTNKVSSSSDSPARADNVSQLIPRCVSDFMSGLRLKLELEADVSALGSVRLSQVQCALTSLASVLADLAAHVTPLSSKSKEGFGGLDTIRPSSIVPAAIARNIFTSVKAITVIYTSAPQRHGLLRRVPAGSSGAGKAETVGDGAKLVLVVTPDDGHQQESIREQLMFDTLRVEMSRVGPIMQGTISDLRHQLSTYYPASDFIVPYLSAMVSGPDLPRDAFASAPSFSSIASVARAKYVSEAEKLVYMCELLKSATVPTAVPSAVLHALIKGLAIGWDTALGTKLRGYIKTIEVTAPTLCPMSNASYAPSVRASTCISYDCVLGVLRYECPALYYPPPRDAVSLSSLILGPEAIAGQTLVAISGSGVVDLGNDVDLAKPFAPFCVAGRVRTSRPQSTTSWVAVAGEQFSFTVEQRNILDLALGEGVDALNKKYRETKREEMLEELDTAIAGDGRRVDLGDKLRRIDAKVRSLELIKPQWAQSEALQVAITSSNDNKTLTNIVSNLKVAAGGSGGRGALIVSFTAPKKSGWYTVNVSLYGTLIGCGSPLSLRVKPSVPRAPKEAEIVFPRVVSFFRGKQPSPSHQNNKSATSSPPAKFSVRKGKPFTVQLPMKDTHGNYCAYSELHRDVVITLNGQQREMGRPATNINDAHHSPSHRLDLTLLDHNDALTIVSAHLMAWTPNGYGDRYVRAPPVGTAYLELTLVHGDNDDERKNKRGGQGGDQRKSHIKSRPLSDDQNNSESEDDDEMAAVEEAVSMTNVCVTAQLLDEESGLVEDTQTITLFQRLTVRPKQEWLSAEAARRGILSDLNFMRKNRREVREAIVRYCTKVLPTGGGGQGLRGKKVAKEAIHEQYDRMKKRLAERFSLYFRRSTRRALLARRQTDAESVGLKGVMVPSKMLLGSINSILFVDESKLGKKEDANAEK